MMSFYSVLVLAANDGALPPTPEAIHSLFSELGLLNPRCAGNEFGNLADHITALFRDTTALAENPQFFAPDSIGFAEGVEICTPEGDYTGPGWSVRIHGNGYFFPWELSDLRDRAIRSPALSQLRVAVEERFGGRFTFPAADKELLRGQLIDETSGCVWFASESV